MFRRAFLMCILLISVSLIYSQAQNATPVQRLGISVQSSPPIAWSVVNRSAADRAGVKANDALLMLDRQPFVSFDEARRLLESAAPGEHQLLVLRSGKAKNLKLEIEGTGSNRIGFMLMQGVRVKSIESRALAERFGLREGDLVTSVRYNDQMLLTRKEEELVNLVAAIPASERFGITYLRDTSSIMHTGLLDSQPTADASVLSQAQPAPSRGGAGISPEAPVRPAIPNSRGESLAHGATRGENAIQGGQAQGRPSPGGRIEQRIEGMRRRNFQAAGAGGNAQRNTTLDQLLTPASYRPSSLIAKRIEEINVLKYAYFDRKTGDVVFAGAYDPTYATGPIPYGALLANAVENPYPRFTLEFPGSGNQSPLGTIRATLDQEFARIARDPNYGVQWMGRLILPVLKGDSSDPDQQAALNARLRALDISPASYRAYMKWQLDGFKDMQAYQEGAADFLPRVMALAGLNPKVGAEITAYRVFATAGNRDSLEAWCRVAGMTDLLQRIDEQMRNGGDKHAGSAVLLPALYGSILRGLGMSDNEVSRIEANYKSQGGNEGVLVTPLEQRYQAAFQQFLINKLVNGMSFTGATLSGQYSFPTILSSLNTYGARRDSPVMNAFFQADYMLKFMTSSPRPAERIPGHQTSQQYLSEAENRAGQAAGRTPSSGVIRYWLYPQQVTLDPLSGNAGVHFRNASVRVGVEMLQSEDGDATGRQFYKTTLDQYSEHLTSLYDQYARLYPALHTLRETEKVIALARWAQKNGVQIRVQAGSTPPAALPESAPGFWGMTYVVRPTGSTDTMVTWAQGGVDFGQSTGDDWVQTAQPDRQVTNDALRSLAASTAFAEKAAAAANGGDLEAARNLAERSAQAMSGNIDLTGLPEVPMPSGIVADPAEVISVSKASIEAVDMNTQGLQQARQGIAEAESMQATDPARAAQIRQQNLELQEHSQQNLNRLQTMLQEYRNSGSNGPRIAVDLRGLDPNKPATAGLLPPESPAAKPVALKPAGNPCPQGIEKVLPTRQEMLTELASRRLELENLRNTLMRLNMNIQLDQKQFTEWETEAQDAIDRITERKNELWRDAGFGLMTYGIDKWAKFDESLTPTDLENLKRKMEIMKGAKDLKEFSKWALSNKKDWEMIEDGVRKFFDFMPLAEEPMAIVKGAEALIDNIYDVIDYQATWENLNRLNHSSDQYLEIVKQNGEKMKALVTRISELQVQLRATPAQPPNASPCKEGGGGNAAPGASRTVSGRI